MFNVCDNCGAYHVAKRIQDVPGAPAWSEAICPECGHAHRFRRLPLLIVSGAGGTGKTTVCRHLTGHIEGVVPLEGDILWRPEFDTPDDAYRGFGETWLRLVKNIAQSGRPVVLFGAGLGVPENLEHCMERRYIGTIHRLALTCAPDQHTARLRARPEWRGCDEEFIARHIDYNRWFLTTGPQLEPPIELLDTTTLSVEETVSGVARWIRVTLAQDPATAS